MFNPSNPAMGRGMLLFAAIAAGLGIVVGVGQQSWRDAIFWLGLAIFTASYGMITLNALPRLQRPLLIVGLVAGGVVFWLALQAALAGGG